MTLGSALKRSVMFFFFQAEDGIRDIGVTGVQTCALPILARLADDAHAGGMLSGKAGVTHFHVGEQESRLQPLRDLIDDYGTPPEWLYPTHVERSEALMSEAVELARRGSFVDVDTVEEDLHVWLRFYLEHGGPPDRLTASSDASISSPGTLYRQVRACVLERKST